jgi:hypothetical protein
MAATTSSQHFTILWGVSSAQPWSENLFISPWMEHGNIRHFLKQFPDANRIRLVRQLPTLFMIALC